MMTFPTEWKNNIHVPVTTNQKCILKRQITSEKFIGQLIVGLHPVSPIAPKCTKIKSRNPEVNITRITSVWGMILQINSNNSWAETKTNLAKLDNFMGPKVPSGSQQPAPSPAEAS